MRVRALMLILFTLGVAAGCASHHQPLSGPVSDPLTYPAVRGQAGRELPALREIPTGVAEDYQAYPVLEPDEIVRVWVVGQTRSDIAHVHGHWLTINYRPSRFKPDQAATRNRVPTGRLLAAPQARDEPTESSQVPLRSGQASPAPPPSRAASDRDGTQAVREAYRQIQQHLQQQPGAGRALEAQIREMTRRIQQQRGAPSP